MQTLKTSMAILAMLAMTGAGLQAASASETRLKRPKVLYGSAIKKGSFSARLKRQQSPLEGSSSVDRMFPTVTTAPAPISVRKNDNIQPPLSGKLSRQELGLLAKRDLVLFVDRSYSMNTRDCPEVVGGINVNDRSPDWLDFHTGFSRWRWTANQSLDLANQLAPYMPHGFRLILFNDNKQVFNNVKPGDIQSIFMSTKVGGSENIVKFLQEEINSYLHRKKVSPTTTKPLAVAIMTDGLPDDRKNFPAILTGVTQKMTSADDIRIVFVQVGKSRMGGNFLRFLDNQLTSMGARYDIVDHKSFDQLKASGVGRAMVDAIRE